MMARKLVEDIHPAKLNTAINDIAQISKRHDAYARLGCREEPTEVNAVVTATQLPHRPSERQTTVPSTVCAPTFSDQQRTLTWTSLE